VADAALPRPIAVVATGEDEGESAALAVELLAESGVTAVPASSVEEALAAVRETDPDLVLAFEDLGGASGHDLVRRLRGGPESAGDADATDTPVIMISPEGAAPDLGRAIFAGADYVLPHAFGHAEFLAHVRAALRRGELGAQARARAADLERELAARQGEIESLRLFSETVLRSLVSAVVVVNDRREVVFANEEFARRAGRQDVLGRPLIGLLPHGLGTNEALAGALDRVFETREPVTLDRLRARVGEGTGGPSGRRVFTLRVSSVPFGGAAHALLVLDDVTERTQSRDEIVRERRKLDDIVQAIGAGLCLMDRERRVLWANRTFAEWFGDPSERRCHEVFRASSSVCENCSLSRAIETGQAEREEWSIYTSGGLKRYFQNVIAPILDESGELLQFLVLTQDVTERQSRIEQLSLVGELGRAMAGVLDLDRLLHVVLTCATAGHALGFNRAFLFLRDREANELRGRMGVGPASREDAFRIWAHLARRPATLHDLVTEGEMPAAAEQPLQRLVAPLAYPMDASHLHETVVRTAIERRPILVRNAAEDERVSEPWLHTFGANEFVSVPLMAKGEVNAVLVADNLYSGRPITDEHVALLQLFANQAALAIENAAAYQELTASLGELRRTTDQLVQAENLAAIGRMAAHVAHEIRNPLVTIGGFARGVLKHPENAERAAKSASIICEEVARLESILANVMDFTKPAAPVFAHRPLNRLVSTLLDAMRREIEAQGVRLKVELDPTLGEIEMDAGQVRQVVLNLVRNAVESMSGGGTLTVRTARNEHGAELTVRDTGRGIEPGVLEDIFSPFFTTKSDGTGLGLAVTQKIVTDHGGSIHVASEPDKGTAFTIALPCEQGGELS